MLRPPLVLLALPFVFVIPAASAQPRKLPAPAQVPTKRLSATGYYA